MAYDPADGLINGANLVGGLINQGRKTEDYIGGLFDAHAKMKAGEAVARGDYGSAAGLLGARGMTDDAEALRGRETTTKALKAASAGDYQGAEDAAAAGGDTALYNSTSAAETKDKTDRAAWLGHAADALLQIKDPNQRHQAFASSIAPTLKAMGVADDQISQIDQQSLSDQGLQAFKTTLGQHAKLSIQKLDDGSLVGVDESTGAIKELYKGGGKHDWKERKNADGSSEWIDLNDPNAQGGSDSAPSATPAPTGGVYDTIAAKATGLNAKPEEVSYLQRLAQVESGGKTDARNGSSTGVFQFHPDTFAGLGGQDINDVGDQTKAALALQQRDRAALQAAGIAPTDANTYIMHQQGAGGGKALLTAPPETNAIAVLTPVYGSEKIARKAILGNGGNEDMTAGDFVDYWQNRWSGGGKTAATGPKSIKGDEAPRDDGSLSDDAAEQAAERYITNGTLPPMGQGKVGTQNRDKILNKAAEMEKLTGRTGSEAVAAWADVKANTSTLADLTKRRANIKSFEDNALANADLALKLAPAGAGQFNSPILNKWAQTGRKAVAGDPDVTSYDVALGTFLDEYAKITSGSMGNQGTTDASRREAYDRLSKYASKGQVQAGIATMKLEMGNRIMGLDKEIAKTKSNISGKPAPAAEVTAPHVSSAKDLSPPQLAKAMQFKGSTAKSGDRANPWVVKGEAMYAKLPTGVYYITPDGEVRGPKP